MHLPTRLLRFKFYSGSVSFLYPTSTHQAVETMSDQPSPLWERYGTRPAPMPNPQQNSFLPLGSESNRPLSSTSSIASDPFARSKQNLQKPEMPSSRSQSREPSIRSGRAVATAKTIDDYEASNFQTVKAAQILTGIVRFLSFHCVPGCR